MLEALSEMVVNLLYSSTLSALLPSHSDLLILTRPNTSQQLANLCFSRFSAITMGYENYVYLAKLAEQAERYEGTLFRTPSHPRLINSNGPRNGGEYEERRISRPRALCRRTKPPLSGLQERHWRASCLLENRHIHRAEGRIKRQ